MPITVSRLMLRLLRTATFTAAVLGSLACRTTPHTWDPVDHAYALPAETLLRPGSLIAVRFYYTPELDVEQTILPDGTVSLPLIGTYRAAGKSPHRVERELTMLYDSELREPKLSVVVQGLSGQGIAVGGEVRDPGPIEMPDAITVLEAVMQAGGPDRETADVHNIVVLREDEGVRRGFIVDLGPALAGMPSPPFYLQPRDMIFVPPTRVTKVNQWIEQYIDRMVPQFGFTFTRSIGDNATVGVDTSRRR